MFREARNPEEANIKIFGAEFNNKSRDPRTGGAIKPAGDAEYPRDGKTGIIRLGNSDTQTPSPNSFGYLIALHELGHALGLKHGFEREERNSQVIAQNQDNIAFSIMEYDDGGQKLAQFHENGVYRLPGGNKTSYALRPMDVAAVQALYGKSRRKDSLIHEANETGSDWFKAGAGKNTISANGGNNLYTLGWGGDDRIREFDGSRDKIVIHAAHKSQIDQVALYEVGDTQILIATSNPGEKLKVTFDGPKAMEKASITFFSPAENTDPYAPALKQYVIPIEHKGKVSPAMMQAIDIAADIVNTNKKTYMLVEHETAASPPPDKKAPQRSGR